MLQCKLNIKKDEERIMKKRITVLLTVSALLAALFAGCGSSGSTNGQTQMTDEKKSGSMTVSEMLDSVLNESQNGRITIYRYGIVERDGHVDKLKVYEYDGTNIYEATNVSIKCTPEQIISGEVDIVMSNEGKAAELKMYNIESSNEYIDVHKGGGIGFYNTFSHVEIAGISFMCFSYYGANDLPDSGYTYYTLIQDTKETKNKTIVYDTEL